MYVHRSSSFLTHCAVGASSVAWKPYGVYCLAIDILNSKDKLIIRHRKWAFGNWEWEWPACDHYGSKEIMIYWYSSRH